MSSSAPHNQDVLTGKQFVPQLMSEPFHHGLVIVFTAAALLTVVGAIACLLSGSRPVRVEQPYDAWTVEGVEMLIVHEDRGERARTKVTDVRRAER